MILGSALESSTAIVTQNGGAMPVSVSDDCSPTLKHSSWFAVQTRPRHEKKVSAELVEKGLHSFLPVHQEKRQWSDRKKWIELPLFSHYVFVRIPEDAELRTWVLRTSGVIRFAGASGHGTPIPDAQIESLYTLIGKQIPLAPHSYVDVGEKVRIRGGVLNGLEGILVAIKDDKRFVVSVEIIQRSVAVQLEGFEVERV
jgi:transcriptional antiterminator NusG